MLFGPLYRKLTRSGYMTLANCGSTSLPSRQSSSVWNHRSRIGRVPRFAIWLASINRPRGAESDSQGMGATPTVIYASTDCSTYEGGRLDDNGDYGS